MTQTVIDLETRNVSRHYGNFTAVNNVNLQIEQGSFFSILGPSGCGKTTLLRMVAGFDEPDSGDILIQGLSMLGVPPNQRPANMVFQHLALFPMMTVAENIAYGLKRRKVKTAEINKRIENILESMSLGGAGNKKISQLSGGQKQRIAIARCLVLEPKLLLLDEPLGALDLKLREQMKVELKQMQQRVGTTFIYITHDQSEALIMSNQIAVMNQGRFEQLGPPANLYYQPESAFVAGFVGDANRWKARVTRTEGQKCTAELEDGLVLSGSIGSGEQLAADDKIDIFVRPEAIKIVADSNSQQRENCLTCTVEDLLFNGANTMVLMKEMSSGKTLHIALPQTGDYRDLTKGEKLNITWGQQQTLCFKDEN